MSSEATLWQKCGKLCQNRENGINFNQLDKTLHIIINDIENDESV